MKLTLKQILVKLMPAIMIMFVLLSSTTYTITYSWHRVSTSLKQNSYPKYAAVFYNMKYSDNSGNIMSMIGEHVYEAWKALRDDGWAFPTSAPSNGGMFNGSDNSPYTVSDYQITKDAFYPSSSTPYYYIVYHRRAYTQSWTSEYEPRLDAFTFVYKAGHGLYDRNNDKGIVYLSYLESVAPPDWPNGLSHYLRFYWNDGCHGNWGWFWYLSKGHLVWGYKTIIFGGPERVKMFFINAFQKNYKVWYAYYLAIESTIDTPDNSVGFFISGRTTDQLNNDHMPGHGYIAPDSDPGSNTAYYYLWWV